MKEYNKKKKKIEIKKSLVLKFLYVKARYIPIPVCLLYRYIIERYIHIYIIYILYINNSKHLPVTDCLKADTSFLSIDELF